MRTKWITIISLMALLFVAAPASQAQQQLLFRVNIPFDFVAGGAHLSAGEYIAFHTTPTIIQLVRRDRKASAWVPVKATPTASGEPGNLLIFNRYGQSYFLASIVTGHDQQIHECFRCKSEQMMIAQTSRPVEIVAVNAEPPR